MDTTLNRFWIWQCWSSIPLPAPSNFAANKHHNELWNDVLLEPCLQGMGAPKAKKMQIFTVLNNFRVDTGRLTKNNCRNWMRNIGITLGMDFHLSKSILRCWKTQVMGKIWHLKSMSREHFAARLRAVAHGKLKFYSLNRFRIIIAT